MVKPAELTHKEKNPHLCLREVLLRVSLSLPAAEDEMGAMELQPPGGGCPNFHRMLKLEQHLEAFL
jgi:hypothetical protein